MNELEDRLERAGRDTRPTTPDLGSIAGRAAARRRNRRVLGTSAVVLVAVAVGVGAFRLVDSQTQIVIAADGNDDLVTTTIAEGAPQAPQSSTTEPAVAETVEAEEGPPSPEALSDTMRGWLTVEGGEIVHVSAEVEKTVIAFPEPEGGFVQRWVTDLGTIDGRPMLFVDQFVNRDDLSAIAIRDLYDQYGAEYTGESGPRIDLEGVATDDELQSLDRFEVSILAVDLVSNEVIEIEHRLITSITSPEWFYNGHITTDGTRILVMRELWQGTCMYAEALAIDGTVLEWPTTPVPTTPGLAELTAIDIQAVFDSGFEPIEECVTLDEIGDEGRAILGTQADQRQLGRFKEALFEAGWG